MGELLNETALGLPALALRPFVGFYAGCRQRGMAPGTHRGLPSGWLSVVVTLETPMRICAGPADHPPKRFETSVGGLHTGPVEITHDGCQDGVYIALRPRAARVLLGIPPGKLTSDVVDLREVLGKGTVELRERLYDASSWHERFAILDAFLLHRRGDDGETAGDAYRVWEELAASGGAMKIGVLADRLGWSRRHLGSLFRREFGIAPKTAARVLRLDHSRVLLERRAVTGLAEVATACGYADQAHLTREWQALAGCTPTMWKAEELPNLQESAAEPVRS